jgi:predicted MFS family arabinose efflux permease
MMMPFSSAFMVNNIGIGLDELPIIYVVTGVFALFMGPIIGRVADKVGKYLVFSIASVLGMIIVVWYSHLGPTPIWFIIVINVVMFVAITGRIVPASALTSAVPAMRDRGAYMSISGSIQQVSGGIAASIGGAIVVTGASGKIERFDILGFVVAGAMLVTLVPMWVIDRQVRAQEPPPAAAPAP